jgi:PAS domain S-box-containing protein
VYEDPEAIPAELRDRLFDAVEAELLDLGIDRFGIDGVARRAGVEPSVIREHWHDRRVLLMAVLLHPAVAAEWSPDTGSLYTDLDVVSALATDDSQTATGRALFRRVLPGSGDVDLAEISSDLWKARFDSDARILRRAADRGQLRDGVDPDEAIRMFAAAFYYDVIFADSPVRPEYADQVVDIFLHGVLGAAGRDRPWPGIESLLQQSGDGECSSLADHAVEAARRAVALMRAGADALIDPVVLYEAVRDEHGRIVDFTCRELNRAACEESGLPRTELLGQRLLETLPGFESSGLLARYANCLERGEPLVLNDFAYQHFDQPRRLDIRAARAGAELITVTWRDVTERLEAAQRDQRYRKLMDSSAVPAALATPDGRLILVNQAMATFVGYGVDTLLTMSWHELTAPETMGDELEAVAEMMAGRRDTYRGLKQYIHADGHRIWADLSFSCIRGPGGEVEHLIGQVIDVTRYLSGRDPDGG